MFRRLILKLLGIDAELSRLAKDISRLEAAKANRRKSNMPF